MMKVKGGKTMNQQRMEALRWHMDAAESWLEQYLNKTDESIYSIRGYGSLNTCKLLIDVLPESDELNIFIERYNKLVSTYGTEAAQQ